MAYRFISFWLVLLGGWVAFIVLALRCDVDESGDHATHRNIALLVAGCYFMEMLDGTIVITASPQIGRSLRAPPRRSGWSSPRTC